MHSAAAPAESSTGAGDPIHWEMVDEVERQFGILMVNAKNSLKTRAAAIDPQLSMMGFKVLTLLVRSGAKQQGFLAEQMDIDKAMMSRTIKSLECLGLAERRMDPEDGRAQLLSMTTEGRHRMDTMLAGDRQMLQARLAEWGTEEVRRFADLLAKLNASES